MSRAHSPSSLSLHLRHSSFWFSKLSVTSPTSQLILQPFRYFTYVTAHSPTLLSPLIRHRIFTYVTWRAAHVSHTLHICLTYWWRMVDFRLQIHHLVLNWAYLLGILGPLGSWTPNFRLKLRCTVTTHWDMWKPSTQNALLSSFAAIFLLYRLLATKSNKNIWYCEPNG